ncbi:hypothetical protein [Methanoregula sp.]|uniref:hypothetical protein n=1 Tax=Methanoregula sp. TaxID=2052170 RepID=UPI003566D98A
MKLREVSVVMLALLLAAMAMVPMVSAGEISQSDKVQMAELNAFAASENSKPLPQLQYDKSPLMVSVTGEFQVNVNAQNSPVRSRIATSATPEVSQLPFGAIVYDSGSITTVFDPTGKQLFAVDDATTPLVSTPDGSLPATSVFEIPDNSLIMENQNTINVFYDNKRILTVMGNPAGARKKTVSKMKTYSPGTLSPQWIEYGETAPISSIGQFSARYNVPKKPTLTKNFTTGHPSLDGSQSTIWNGLQDRNGTYLLQPVLEWYIRHNAGDPYPYEANWSIATWWISPWEFNNNGFHSTRRYGIPSTGELVSTGDLMQGNMYYNAGSWSGAITDLTLGISSSLQLNTTQSSNLTYRNLRAYTVLEGWDPTIIGMSTTNFNSNYIPGNITFGNIIINDRDGNSVIPSGMPGYINSATWDVTSYGLSVTNTSWPTSIKLNTGNI